MKKDAYFIEAMRVGEYRRRAWVISVFSLTNEGADDWKKSPYPYRLVQTPTGYFYVDPVNIDNLIMIEDVTLGQPLFNVNELLTLPVGSIANSATEIETTYGKLLFNYTILFHSFGNKIGYINKRTSPGEIEGIILPRLADVPPEGEARDDDKIYVDEYLKFCDAMFYLATFTQLCVPAHTKKSMQAAPGIHELRNKLLEENKDRLHDASVVAKIDAALVAHDREYLKGDPAENFLITKKSFNIVRKKLYGMHGAEVGLKDTVSVDLVTNSLVEGWNVKDFPALNNSLRAGAFNRGQQTMLGGESVKWLLRASSNVTVTVDDCGSKTGVELAVIEKEAHKLIGFRLIEGDELKLITDADMAKTYVGKTVTVRSPMFCLLPKTDYCKYCVGEKLATNPTGLSIAIAAYGSAFLQIYMKAAHAKELALAKLDFRTAFQ